MFGKLFSRLVDPQDRNRGAVAQEFRYCPSCGDEFRSEFLRCTVCDCDLVPGSASPSRYVSKRPAVAANSAKPIRPYESGLAGVSQGSLLDLKRIKNLLKDQGIASSIEGEGPDCLKSCCGGSKSFVLKVRESDIEYAGQILSRDFRHSTALDTHDLGGQAGAVFDERAVSTCPACGFNFVPVEPVCPECGLCF